MYQQVLSSQTEKVIDLLKRNAAIAGFYLSGGTALALQLGHRESEDLDFFSEQPFDPLLLQQALEKIGKLTSTELQANTLNTFLNGVKLQFLTYPYPLLKKTIIWDGIHLSSLEDIACTKMITVSMRGSKKDFVDIYFLLQRFTMDGLLSMVSMKYENVDYNTQHLLKSLVYFEDAEDQPMPRMHVQVDWETLKLGIIQAVRSYRF